MTAAEVTPDLIQIFREEAAEHLDGMVSCLIAVEAGQASGETTDALFRHAHSIKGSAGMVGLQEAAPLPTRSRTCCRGLARQVRCHRR